MKRLPKITVITICFNGVQQLERTINSVLSQDYPDKEYIIIDGASTDGSVDIIKRYAERLHYWSSEHDWGISDAFNKGIRLAQGDYIQLLNVGDVFLRNDSLSVAAVSIADSYADVISFEEVSSVGISKLSQDYNPFMINHQSAFVSRMVYERLGGYDLKLRIRMDYDFWMRVLPKVEHKHHQDQIVMYSADLSGTPRNAWRYSTEGVLIEYLYGRRSFLGIFALVYLPAIKWMRLWVRQIIINNLTHE